MSEQAQELTDVTPVADIAAFGALAENRFRQATGEVAAFPRARFLEFVRRLKVQSKDFGLVELEFLGSQTYVLDEIIRGLEDGVTTFVILKGRQQGISTLFLAIDLFWAFEYDGLLGIFATHDEGSRDQFRNQIDLFLKTLPANWRVTHVTNNRTMLVLANRSLFRYLVAGTRTTTNKMGRSGGCNFLHATEVAFWGSADDLKALGQTLTKTFPHRMYSYESTANGFNHFYDLCQTAKTSPAMRFIFSGWWRDERNEFGEKHPLYLKYMPQAEKTPLNTLERRRVKDVREQYGFDITAGQIAWYRCHLETECASDQSAMDQEHPWTADDAFIATGSSFFSSETLTAGMKEAKKSLCMPFILRLTDNFQDTRLLSCNVDRSELKIWAKPSPHGVYAIGADPIFGSSAQSDNGCISVWRCFSDCCEQVAEYASPSVSTFQFAWALAFLAGLYRDVTLNLEITGPGAAVYQELGQLRQKLSGVAGGVDPDMRDCLKYMKDFLFRKADSMSGNVLKQWKTSPETRIMLLHKYHDGFNLRRAHVHSLACLDEMRFMMVEDGGYIAVPASKCDDRVFGSALAYWCWDENIRTRLVNNGETREKALARDAGQNDTLESNMVARYMKNAKITRQ